MPKFKIVFNHTVVQTFEAEVEADNRNQASMIFNEDPFERVIGNGRPIMEQGFSLEIQSIDKK